MVNRGVAGDAPPNAIHHEPFTNHTPLTIHDSHFAVDDSRTCSLAVDETENPLPRQLNTGSSEHPKPPR